MPPFLKNAYKNNLFTHELAFILPKQYPRPKAKYMHREINVLHKTYILKFYIFRQIILRNTVGIKKKKSPASETKQKVSFLPSVLIPSVTFM